MISELTLVPFTRATASASAARSSGSRTAVCRDVTTDHDGSRGNEPRLPLVPHRHEGDGRESLVAGIGLLLVEPPGISGGAGLWRHGVPPAQRRAWPGDRRDE